MVGGIISLRAEGGKCSYSSCNALLNSSPKDGATWLPSTLYYHVYVCERGHHSFCKVYTIGVVVGRPGVLPLPLVPASGVGQELLVVFESGKIRG